MQAQETILGGIFNWLVPNPLQSVQFKARKTYKWCCFPNSLNDRDFYVIFISRQMVRTQFTVQFHFTDVFYKQHGKRAAKEEGFKAILPNFNNTRMKPCVLIS